MHTLTVLNSNNSKLSKGFQGLTKDFYQKLSFLDFHIHCQVQGTHNVNNTSTIINTGTCRNIMIETRKWGASFLSCIFEQEPNNFYCNFSIEFLPFLKWSTKYLHFLDKCGIWLREAGALVPAQRGARVEEVDSEIRVVTFNGLADVLEKYTRG